MDLILYGELMSRVVLPKNHAGEVNIIVLFRYLLLIVLGGSSTFLSVGSFLLIPLLLSQVAEDSSIAWTTPNYPQRYK
jgi:hypothetical protein